MDDWWLHRRLALKRGWVHFPEEPLIHNYTTYNYWKCSCEVCKAANTSYHRALRAKEEGGGMSEAPSPEEFGRTGRGSAPRQQQWLKALAVGVPTLLPVDVFTRRDSIQRREAVYPVAKMAGVPITALVRNDDVWVMRKPDA